jgi:hypothetical protein
MIRQAPDKVLASTASAMRRHSIAHTACLGSGQGSKDDAHLQIARIVGNTSRRQQEGAEESL